MSRTRRARKTIDALRKEIPQPETELKYNDEYQLLVAVILSAQCTDERVNKETPALFEAFPTVQDMAQASPEEIYPYVKSITYPNNKSKHLSGMAEKVCDEFNGTIPQTPKDLRKLPGVGRKTAQVVASVAYQVDAFPVDTHVFRVSNRIGLVKSDATTPRKVERQIKRVIPKDEWSEAHHLLILHGRYTCTARSPSCDECPLTSFCTYYQRLQRRPEPLDNLDQSRGAYYCKTCDRYFNKAAIHVDRYNLEQTACSSCGSMNVFATSTGQSTKEILDYRVG